LAIGATVLITFPAASNHILTADGNVFVTKVFALLSNFLKKPNATIFQ
jgi:hypothetical protein